MSAGDDILPFPDLTGLRSGANDRQSSDRAVCVKTPLPVKRAALSEIARHADESLRWTDVVIAAWTVVLTHLLSAEDRCVTRTAIVQSPDQTELLEYESNRSVRNAVDVLELIRSLKKATKPLGETQALPQGIDNGVLFVSPSESSEHKDRYSVQLEVEQTEEDDLELALYASPKHHTSGSAALHLQQLVSYMESICAADGTSDSFEKPAFSFGRFPPVLLAGDGDPHEITHDFRTSRTETERLEYQFGLRAKQYPDRIALDFRATLEPATGQEQDTQTNVRLTYAQLDEITDRIAREIRSSMDSADNGKGPRPKRQHEIVALFLDKSHWTYVAILATLKAGCTWCPIDTDWPVKRKELLLGKSKATVVLTTSKEHKASTLEDLVSRDVSIIRLDQVRMQNGNASDVTLPERVPSTSSDLAYLIWTSGTTGIPKAVGIQHKAAVQALRALQNVIPYDDKDTSKIRYLQFSAYNFDLMILDMFYTLGLGGTLCSSTRTLLLTDLVRISNAFEATHTLLTPAIMAMTPRRSIPSLQVVINGGEKLSQIVADTWSVDCCLLNLYGPAEATLIAMHRRVPANDCVKAPNIGRALLTTSCHALDVEDKVVLKGCVGQLVLGGFQCALGYIGDEEKTAEKFIEHNELGRIYKTGDMVRQLWNGDFEYLGRIDDQVKINGIRIELLEINAAIRSASEEIKDSETMVLPTSGNDGSDVQIVNFSVLPSKVATNSSQLIRIDEEALQAAYSLIGHARDSLPSYMVPSLVLIVQHFPKTSSAKIDREALKAALAQIDVLEWQNRLASHGIGKNEGAVSADGTAMSNEMALRLGEYIAKICRIRSEQVGRHTPFPQLGLDSIRAIALARQLNADGITVSVLDLIDHNTLASLAEQIERSKAGKDDDRIQKAHKALSQFDEMNRGRIQALLGSDSELVCVLPATPLQESLIAETLQDRSRYWLHRLFDLPKGIQGDRVTGAISKTLDEFEILRTLFISTAEANLADLSKVAFKANFVQAIVRHPSSGFREVETDSSIKDDAALVSSVCEKRSDFVVNTLQPPVRFTRVKSSDKLIMHIHHALYDQVSLEIIASTLAEHLKDAHHASNRTLSSQFAEALPYMLTFNDAEREEQLRTWNVLLQPLTERGGGQEQCTIIPPKLSFSHRGSKSNPTSKVETFSRQTELHYHQIGLSAQRLSSSVRPIVQIALASVLSKWCDSKEIMLGDAISGRTLSASLDDVVGPVLSTLPVLISLETDKTFRQMSSSLTAYHRQALGQAHIPLSEVRRMLRLPRTSELFHALFVFEHSVDSSGSGLQDHDQGAIKQNELRTVGDYGIAVEHPLAFEVSVNDEGRIVFALNVHKGYADVEVANLLLAQVEETIKYSISHVDDKPDAPVGAADHETLSEGSVDPRVLAISRFDPPKMISNATSRAAFLDFVEQAQLYPERVAVELHIDLSGTASTMTYRRLHVESTQLAKRLQEKLAPKSVVAVTLPRSHSTYVALLGILMSGCVYLPIDESLPLERKRLLLASSNAACLVYHRSVAWLNDRERGSTILLELSDEGNMTAMDNAIDRSHQSLPTISKNDPAYILYTSGSTGTPKGCMLSHENLAATLASFRWTYDEYAPGSLDENVRFLARSIESFDVALLEALLPLQIGGTVVTAPRYALLSNLGKAMQVLRVTHAAVVPSLFYIDARRVRPTDLPDLRALIVGGERIQRDIIDEWAGSKVPLLNAYGPTEACIGNSIARLRPHDETGNVGRPFPSTQYIVFKHNPTKVQDTTTIAMRGEAGELGIAGLQVGSYLADTTEIRSQSFILFQGMKVYKTGDEVRMWHDDTIEYLGRIGSSNQVKVRGARMELGEIDSAMLDHGQTRGLYLNTCLLTHTSFPSARLVTFASQSTSSNNQVTIKAADAQLAQRMSGECLKKAKAILPSFMVPSMVIALEALPLAPISGKINTKRLAQWFANLSSSELHSLQANGQENFSGTSNGVDTFNGLEKTIWDEIVRLFKTDQEQQNDLRLSTDLFSFGLDSLNIIVLCGSLAKKTGVRFEVSHIMSDASIKSIAQAIQDAQSHTQNQNSRSDWTHLTQEAQAKLEGSSGTVRLALPCLPLQESMVAQSRLDLQDYERQSGAPKTIRYINVSQYLIKCSSVDRLQRTMENVLHRHEIYQTVFADLNDALVQVIFDPYDDDTQSLRSLAWKSDREWSPSAVRQDIIEQIARVPPLRYQISATTDSADRLLLNLAIHHSLYDGASLDSLLHQISIDIDNSESDVAQQVRETSYGEYVQSMLSTSEEDRLDYWLNRLANMAVNPFPSLTGRKATNNLDDVCTLEQISLVSLSSMKQSARRENVTLAMLLLHAFMTLYATYVADESVVVGLVLGSTTTESAKVHGPCVNTVPFGAQTSGTDSLAQLKQAFADALRYQHVPLTKLSRRLGLPHSVELFNTLFSFMGEREKDKSESNIQELSSQMDTGYPLALEVETDIKRDAVVFRVVFNRGLLPEKQVEVLLQQLDVALGSPLYGQNEAQSIYSLENPDASERPIQHFIDSFQRQVKARPKDLAFRFAEGLSNTDQEDNVTETTYEDLALISNRMAQSLSSYAKKGSVIGVYMTQCRLIYPLLIAIWKSSMVYLPLDTKLPSDRLEFIIATAKPSLIVKADRTDRQVEKESTTRGVTLSNLLDDSISSTSPVFTPSHSLDDVAYIMFTSGSSGKPKGVEIGHRALGAALASWNDILPFRPGESCMLQLASPGFDVFLIEVCMPLALGFSFASAPKEELLNDLEYTFHRLKITIADLPAALAVTLDPQNVPALEWLMSGGEQLDERVVKAWSQIGLVNAWGPTEATIGNTLGFVRHLDTNRSWIGHSYPTSTLLVLSSNDDVAFRGCIGELAVAGPQLANGYFDNERLTNEKFIHVRLPGADHTTRIYRTGDRGRILSDGSVECLGRIEGDGQVKINSQRVELKEIEIALLQSSNVKDAAVLYLEHPVTRTKQLVAFVISADPTGPSQVNGGITGIAKIDTSDVANTTAQDCLRHAASSLPPYMVPQTCLVLHGPALPLTANNKIDIAALKVLYSRADAGNSQQVSDAGEDGSRQAFKQDNVLSALENDLRTVVAQFVKLNPESIDKGMSLYRLGIDSISGFQLAKRLRQIGLEGVTARDILASPTIASLATRIETTRRETEGQLRSVPSLRVDEAELRTWQLGPSDRIEHVCACPPLQQGILLESLASQGRLYVHHHLFEIHQASEGKIDKVLDTFAALVKRHEMLRTSFHLYPNESGAFVQAIHASSLLPDMELISAKANSKRTLQDDLRSYVQQSSWFADEDALLRPPVLLRIFKDGERALMLLIIHHALYDGQSLQILFSEMEELLLEGSDIDKLEDATPFRLALPTLLSSETDCQHWIDLLLHRSDTMIARTDSGAPANTSCHVLHLEMVDIKLKEATEFALTTGVSLHTIALLSFAKLLAHLTGSTDVTFAQLFNLRDATNDEAEALIGPCFNTCLTSVELRANEGMSKALQRLQKENDESRPFRNASLADIQRGLTEKRGRPIVIDALFDMQRITSRESEGVLEPKELSADGAVANDTADESTRSTQYTLNLEFLQRDDQLTLVATAHTDRFSLEELRKTLKQFEAIFCHLVRQGEGAAALTMPDGMPPLRSLKPLSRPSRKGSGQDAARIITDRTVGQPDVSQLCLDIISTIRDLAQIPASTLIDCSIPVQQFGLDSIGLMVLASRLRKQGLRVGVVDIVQGRSIDGIARRLESQKDAKHKSSTKNLVDRGQSNDLERLKALHILGQDDDQIEAVVDLLPGQVFELSHGVDSQGIDQGLNTFFYRVSKTNAGDLIDISRLSSAWRELRKRHAVLRTSFVAVPLPASAAPSDQLSLKQVVWSDKSVILDDATFGHTILPEDFDTILAQDDGLESLLDHISIDATLRHPPVACHVFASDDALTLALRIHHALYDAWALPRLIEDLVNAYRQPLSRRHPSYVEFAQLVAGRRHDANLLEEAQSYWRSLFEGVSHCLLGAGDVASKGDNTGGEGEEESFVFLRDRLLDVPRLDMSVEHVHGGLRAVILAAVAHVLSQTLQGQDTVFGVYRRGRSSSFEGVEDMIGNCMNILPVVQRMKDGKGLSETAREIQEQIDGQRAYEDICHIGDIVDWTTLDKKVPWNTYVNLLWPVGDTRHQDGNSAQRQATEDDAQQRPFECELIHEVMTRDIKLGDRGGETHDGKRPDKDSSASVVPDLRTDISIDVQLDVKTSSIHFGIRWKRKVGWTREQIERFVKAVCDLVEGACSEPDRAQ